MTRSVIFGGHRVSLAGQEAKVGEKAPQFTVIDGSMQPVSSQQFHDKIRIFSVFPSVDTPVCSLQNRRFNKEAAALGEQVEIIALSVDLPFAQKRFVGEEGIERMRIYSDYRTLDFGMKYGFLIEPLRLLARGVVVVDKDDTIRHVEYVRDIGHEPDYAKALDVVRSLQKK